jgi:poly(beta-D-mannuronate) lyase
MRRLAAIAVLILTLGSLSAARALADPPGSPAPGVQSVDYLKSLTEAQWLSLLQAGCNYLTLDGPDDLGELCGGPVPAKSGLPDKNIAGLIALSDGGWAGVLARTTCTLVESATGALVGTICPLVNGVALAVPSPANSTPKASSSTPKPSSSTPKPSSSSPKPSSSSPKPSSSTPKPSSSTPKPSTSAPPAPPSGGVASVEYLKTLDEPGWLNLLQTGCYYLTLGGLDRVGELCGGSVPKNTGLQGKDIPGLISLSTSGWGSLLARATCTIVKSSAGALVGTICGVVNGTVLPGPLDSSSSTPTPTSSGPTSSDPTSSDPTSSGPTSSDPTSSDPTSSDPTSSDPTGSDPTGSDPTGSDPTGPESGGVAPSSILDLSNWYLGIPVDTPQISGSPDIIRQPQLTGYTSPDWFHSDAAGDGVVFDVNAGGFTTSGSDYPRTELREMNGTQNAAWDSTVGTNTMQVTEAITELAPIKPAMVSAQIHDDSDDVVQVRLDGKVLSVTGNDGKTKFTLQSNYVLGTIFTVKLVATAAGIQVFYNGALATTIAAFGTGYYFKAGAYLQSNVAQGNVPGALGEVIIYDLSVTHTA